MFTPRPIPGARKKEISKELNLNTTSVCGQEERTTGKPSYGQTYKDPVGWSSVPNDYMGFYYTVIWYISLTDGNGNETCCQEHGNFTFFSVTRTFHSKICFYQRTNPNNAMLPRG